MAIANEVISSHSDLLAALGVGRKRRGKFNAQRTEYEGRVYHSKAEAQHAFRLDLEKGSPDSDVVGWTPQFNIPLGEDVALCVDFLVRLAGNRFRCDEVKGYDRDTLWRLKRSLWPKHGPCPLHVIRNGITAEVVPGKGDGSATAMATITGAVR